MTNGKFHVDIINFVIPYALLLMRARLNFNFFMVFPAGLERYIGNLLRGSVFT